MFTLLAVLVALAAFATGLNVLYWILGSMMASLAVSGIISGGMLRRIEVQRALPGHATAGEPFIVRYSVRNRSRWLPIFNIHIEERPVGRAGGWESMMESAPGWVMHVGPHQTVHGEAIFFPQRRGETHFGPLTYFTEFPFGLVRRSVIISESRHLLVFPRVYALRPDLLRRLVPAGPIGTRSGRRAGPGDDFYGLREYRPGDDHRHVAWKRTAHREQILVIERAMASPPRLRVVLDLRTAEGGTAAHQARREDEEKAISLAASLVAAADAEGYEIGLTILGTDRSPIPVRRTLRHHARLMGALASIDLDADRASRDARTLRTGAERDGAGLVVVTPDHGDPALSGGDVMLLSAQRLEHYLVITPPSEREGSEAA